MKILQLLPSLEYGGAARQVLMLGQALAGTCDLRVGVLHGEGPWASVLRGEGVPVDSLGWQGLFDPRPLWRLRRILNDFQPDWVHIWRMPALQLLALAHQKYLARCIVSQPLPTGRRAPRLGKVDRWLLGRVAKIVAGGAAEAELIERDRLGSVPLTIVAPGVVEPVADEVGMPGAANAFFREEGEEWRIVCLGNLASSKGFREALIAADFLTYAVAGLSLTIIGDGPFRPALQRFRQGAYFRDHMHLVGARADAATWLAQADACWVPSLAPTGRQVALEAMAAGRPVIASDLPYFREIIVNGESGILVPPGDTMGLARRTREVFLDKELQQSLGEAARRRVSERYGVGQFVANHQALYGTSPRTRLPAKCNRTPDRRSVMTGSL